MSLRNVLPFTLILLPSTVAAQSEAALKQYFEGRTVTPKLAMPGTDDGVDIYPGTAQPLDYSLYADRLKKNGTAIKAGEPAVVTKIKIKSSHIEFQLGGGGYGTFGDETSSSIPTSATPKSNREKDLEKSISRETDPAQKRELQKEKEDLEEAREREDARNRAAYAAAEENREANIRQRRIESGSRFNIRYPNGVPGQALTPTAVIAALSEFLNFDEVPGNNAAQPGPASSPALRKGMLMEEADSLFGPPLATAERMEGKLRVIERRYSSRLGQVTAEFVEAVLIRYTVASQ